MRAEAAGEGKLCFYDAEGCAQLVRCVGRELKLTPVGELDRLGRTQADEQRRKEDGYEQHGRGDDLGGDEDALDMGQLGQALTGNEQTTPVRDRREPVVGPGEQLGG